MKKPLPLHEPLKVIGRIGKEGSRIFEGSGEILLPDGSVAVEAQGRYIRMPLERIADFDREDQEWRVVPSPNDPEEVEVGAEPGKEPLF
jgi:hypothetical protein